MSFGPRALGALLFGMVLSVSILVAEAGTALAQACPPSDCDDGNPCTSDSCVLGQCAHAANIETRFCARCNDGADNDGDGAIDAEDEDCSTLAKLQRFGVVSQSPKSAMFMGASSEVNSAPGEIAYSTLPYPKGKSVAGVCGRDMKILIGAKLGRLAAKQSRRGITFGQGNSGERDISIRDDFASDGAREVLKARAPFTGPGVCSIDASPCAEPNDPCGDSSAEACCPLAGSTCDGRLRLDDQANPHVTRTGTTPYFLDCTAALASMDAEAMAIESVPANVPGFTDCTRILKSNSRKLPTLRVPATGTLEPGVQVICIDQLKLAAGTTLELHGEADTYLYIRVGRKIILGAGARIVLADGLKPENVLWYVAGDLTKPVDESRGGPVSLNKTTQFRGTLLAPRTKVKLGAFAVVDGAVYAARVFMNGLSKINHYPFLPFVQAPEGANGRIRVDVSAPLLTYDSGTGTVTIENAAGPGGQVIFLSSNNPSLADVPTSVTIPEGETSQTFAITTFTLAGSAEITGFADGFTEGVDTLAVSKRAMTLTLDSPLVAPQRTIAGRLTLTKPAPAGGITVNFESMANLVATIAPASATIAAGATTADVTVTGLNDGSATLRAHAIGGYNDATVAVTVTSAATITIPNNVVIAPGQTLPYPIALSSPAPAGGVTVTLQSANPAIATVTSPAFVPEGATTPTTQPQVTGVTLGPVKITGSATNYAPDTQTVTVQLTALFSPDTISVLTDNTATTTINLSAQAPAGGATITLTTDHPAIATVQPTVFIAEGAASAVVQVTGVAVGNTVLRASGAGIPETTAAITVLPAPTTTLSPVTVGKDLQKIVTGTLEQPAPAGNLQVVLTSTDPGKVLLAPNATTPGVASINVQVPAGSSSFSFYVQSLADTGSVPVTSRATGFGNATTTATLVPSGFVFINGNFTTTAQSPNTALTVVVKELSSTFVPGATGVLRPGVSAAVPVLSSDLTVGEITVSPLMFSGNTSSLVTAFDPIGGPSATLSITQPAGFSTPTSGAQIVATVTAPAINLSAQTVGKDLQTTTSGSLGAPAPAGNLQVTISVRAADTAKLVLSTSATTAGAVGVPLTVQVGAGSSGIGSFYLQALEGSGTAVIEATAPGYTRGTATITLVPSGFVISTPGSFTTQTFSPNTALTIRSCRLSAGACTGGQYQALRAGVSASVNVSSSNPGVGTMTEPVLTFAGNESTQNTGFDPVAAGTTTISINTPSGFSTPTNLQQITATVNAPDLTLQALTIGKDLQVITRVSLTSPAPAGNTQVTVSVSDGSKARLSLNATQLGTTSLTLTVFAGQSQTQIFYVQALDETGPVDLTASTADGSYDPDTEPVTLTPSGFVISAPGSINATTFSGNSNITVAACRLDPATRACSLGTGGGQVLRGGLSGVNVYIDSGTPSVGAITASPLVFDANETSKTTQFDPTAAGTTVIALNPTPPAGFSTPSNLQQFTANVSAPNLNASDLTIGKDLQVAASIGLGVAAPTAMTLTVTVSDPSKVLLSTSATAAGSNQLTFNLAQGATSTGTFWVQALDGAFQPTLTAVAPGYNSTTSTVTLVPSGFAITTPASINTTTFSGNASVTVQPCRLDSVFLNCRPFSPYNDVQALRGGLAPVSVGIASTVPSIGDVTASPLVFNAGELSKTTQFDPVAAGTTVIALNPTPPAGFSTPSNLQQVTATVSAPNLNAFDLTIGKDLQQQTSVSLAVAAPTAMTVTVTVSDPSKVLLSTSATAAGSNQLTFNLPQGATSTGAFWVQALDENSPTPVTLTASAPNYNSDTSDVSLVPSGFVIATGNISVTPYSINSTITTYSCRLNPTTLNCDGIPSVFGNVQALRGGITPPTLTVSSSDTAVGTITVPALTFNANISSQSTQFDPLAVGTSIVSIDLPSGFTKPSNLQQVTATVSAPNLNVSALTIGKDLQVQTSVGLGVAAPSAKTVTVSVSDTSKVLLSTSATAAGTTQPLVFNVAQGATSVGPFYVQALDSTGPVSITASVSDGSYNPDTATITLRPSGFAIQNIDTAIVNTTTSAADTTLTLVPVWLDPSLLTYQASQSLRGGHPPVTINVSSSNPAVGTITLPAVTFAQTDTSKVTSFHPVATGSSIVQVTTPGFATVSDHNNITFIVN